MRRAVYELATRPMTVRLKREVESKGKTLRPQIIGDVVLSPEDIVDFVCESMRNSRLRLRIGDWKKMPGWDQRKVEAMIDFLSEAGLVTPRSRGRASRWIATEARNTTTSQLSPGIVMRKLMSIPPTPVVSTHNYVYYQR